ncbi:MAG: hypothetical protein ACQUHE_02450 [Bacteroidia bacterium]
MDIENKLEELKQIKGIDTPPFLLQSIKNKINNLNEVAAPPGWKYAFIACTIMVALFNLTLLIEVKDKQKSEQIGTVVSSLQLSDNNQLYHD